MSASYWSPASKRRRATAHDDESYLWQWHERCTNSVRPSEVRSEAFPQQLQQDLIANQDVSVCTSLNCQLWLRFLEVIPIPEFPCLRILPSALRMFAAKWGNPPLSAISIAICDYCANIKGGMNRHSVSVIVRQGTKAINQSKKGKVCL